MDGQNRVLIGLPDRLEKAKAAVFALEAELSKANELIAATRIVLKALAERYEDDHICINQLLDMYGMTE